MANLTDEQKKKLEAIKAKYGKPAERPMAAGKAPEAEGPVATPAATAAPPAVVTPAAPEEKDNVVALVPPVAAPPAPVALPVTAPPAKTPETEKATDTSETDVTKPKLALVRPPADDLGLGDFSLEDAETPAADDPTRKFSAEATRKVSAAEAAASETTAKADDFGDLLAGWDVSPDEVAAADVFAAPPATAPPEIVLPPEAVLARPAPVAPPVAAPPVTAPPAPGAALTAKHSIVLSQIGADGEVKEFTYAQDIIKIGKLPSSHLCIDGDKVSRMHAVIEGIDGDYRIIDLGSSTGTIVNGTKVQKAKLNMGDTIQIGSVTLKVKEIRADYATPVVAPPAPAPLLTPPPDPRDWGPPPPLVPMPPPPEVVAPPTLAAPPPMRAPPAPPPPAPVVAPVTPRVKAAAPRVAKPIEPTEESARRTEIVTPLVVEERRTFLKRAGLVVAGGALVGLLAFGLRGGCNCGPHQAVTPPVVAAQEDAAAAASRTSDDEELKRRIRAAQDAQKAAAKAPKTPKVKKAVRPPKVVKPPEKKVEKTPKEEKKDEDTQPKRRRHDPEAKEEL